LNAIKSLTKETKNILSTMKLSVSLLVITLLHIGSTQAMHQSAFDEEYPELPEESERFLVDCNNYYYITTIGMDSKQSLSCTASQLKIIGTQIDKLYDEVVSLDEALSHITLSTNVCTTAKVSTRRNLHSNGAEHLTNEEADDDQRALRELALKYRYSWSGNGRCNLCSVDSSDRRRLSVEGEIDHQQQPHHERQLREAYSVIDFSVDGNGNKLTNKNYVKDEWRAKYGMQVTVEAANGGYAPDGKARIFDSSNPTGNDWDLGTPNEKCPGGGPGKGTGGEPGKRGENCIPEGNLIIIQESNKAEADDNGDGGVMAFSFDSPTRIGHIGIIDNKSGLNSLEVLTADGKTSVLQFMSYGDNSAQLLHVDLVVMKMRVIIISSGGISEIGIFTPTTAKHALSPEARSYIAKKSPLEEYIPYLEFDLSYYLTRRINDLYGRDTSSCLYNKWAMIDVQMDAVKSQPTSIC
jgi:hypothetical protein